MKVAAIAIVLLGSTTFHRCNCERVDGNKASNNPTGLGLATPPPPTVTAAAEAEAAGGGGGGGGGGGSGGRTRDNTNTVSELWGDGGLAGEHSFIEHAFPLGHEDGEQGQEEEEQQQEQEQEQEQDAAAAAGGVRMIGVIPVSAYLFCIYFVLVFGIAGNVALFVLMQHSSLRSISYAVYLRFLAVADSLYLVVVCTEDILDHQFDALFSSIYSSGEITCKVWSFFMYLTPMASPWLVVAFTFDRYLAIVFPFQRKLFGSVKTAVVLCACLVLSLTVEAIVLVVLTEYSHDTLPEDNCFLPDSVVVSYGQIRSLFLDSLCPCALILYFNIHVIIGIKKSSKFRKSASEQDRDKSSAEQRITLSLVAVSTMAFVTLMPLSLLQVVENIWVSHLDALDAKPGNETDVAAMTELEDHLINIDTAFPFVNLIKLLNFGQNFYIMMITSTKYRQLFASILCSGKAKVKASSKAEAPETSRKTEASKSLSTSKDRL